MIIYKYSLKLEETQAVQVPETYNLLTVQVQHGIPCILALVDETTSLREILVRTIGTGHKFEWSDLVENADYIGTYQMNEGYLIFHVLAVREGRSAK